ncbi:helix-turn-helix transcriptional regulator [Dysgonomonas sp. Marseille-P4677]|uniref:helix-turn-helix domain-containing protein n=1 Tax=Dysgonomonas sp. Marseille-P4677 TaxID=2364790 RepID=UPI001914C11F|nr:helix-turn-helix transcriptional regulator [Dysgonomonas sp. Marseille-P4677]MBK5723074.1 helix-turn-helix transcriptional regulator [Dysgonomonas sp. Marseille-P4677]
MSLTREELLKEVMEMMTKSNISGYKLSKATGVAPISISRWKTGKAEPATTTLHKLHKYLYAYLNTPQMLSNEDIAQIISSDIAAKLVKSNFKLISLVQRRSMDEYISKHEDESFLYNLPTIPLRIDESFKGKYMCFEIDGDGMNDGSNKSLLDGDIVLGREIQRGSWGHNIQVSDFYFIIVSNNNISICKILDNNIHGREFICEPLNPIYGEKYSIRMSDVQELYHVVKLVDRQIRL